MKKLVAFTLAVGMVLTTLSGCAAKKTQDTSSSEATSIVESEAAEVSDAEDKDDANSESEYDEPDNVVIECDTSKLIDLPEESIKVTLRGKQILPGRDTAETLQESFENTFVDNSRFAVNRWTPEYVVGPDGELTVTAHSDDFKTEDEPDVKDVIPDSYMFKKMSALSLEEGTQFEFLGLTENSSFDDVWRTMNQYGDPYEGHNYTKETDEERGSRAGVLCYLTKDGYDIQFNFDGFGEYLSSVFISYTPGELSRREGLASLQDNQ